MAFSLPTSDYIPKHSRLSFTSASREDSCLPSLLFVRIFLTGAHLGLAHTAPIFVDSYVQLSCCV